MKRPVLPVVVVAVAIVAPAPADDIDDFVNAAIRQRNIPGVAIAIVKDGVLVRTGGYRLADRERNVAPAPDTVFLIGSLSKQFLAAGIMLLVQDGKLAVRATGSTDTSPRCHRRRGRSRSGTCSRTPLACGARRPPRTRARRSPTSN